jgi:hypothetical protein
MLRPENLFRANFPLAWRYLEMNEARLRGREKGKMDHDGWYGFVYPKNLEHFERPKILVQVLARRAAMTADPEGSFYFVGGGNAGGYGIVLDDSRDLDPFYLLALLNSRTLDAYLQSYASRFQNGYYSYAKRFIGRLPIEIATPSGQEELAGKARELQTLYTSFQEEPLSQSQARIRELEAEVERQVYSTYRLSQDDIAVIEDRIPPETELTEEFGRLLSYGEMTTDDGQ